jgi:hypothetical protein
MKYLKPMMAVAAFALAIGNVQAETINGRVWGVYDKNDEHMLLDLCNNRDMEGIAEMLAEGKAHTIEAGTKVSVLDADIFGGLRDVRVKGSSRGLWVPYEFVSE